MIPNYHYSNLFIFVLLVFALLSSINSEENDLSYLESPYNSAIKMNNGHIFLINKMGMFVTDEFLSSIFFSHLFPTDEQITSESLQLQIKIAQYSKSEGAKILVHTYNKIYFFSHEGEYINNYTLSDMNGVNVQSPQLILLPSSNNCYNYVIIFIDSYANNIVFYSYKIEKDTNASSLINIDKYYVGNSTYIKITCGTMYLEEYGEIISCFYFLGAPDTVKVSHFNLNNNFTSINLEKVLDNLSILSFSTLKGAISGDKSMALICYINANYSGACVKYDIKKNEFSLHNIYAKVCSANELVFSVNFFKETKEFVFACTDNNAKLSLIQFNESGISYITPTENGIEANYSIDKCPNFISFCLLCNEIEKKYIFILFCVINGNFIGASDNVPDSILSHELEFIEKVGEEEEGNEENKNEAEDGNNCIESVDCGDKKYYYEEGSTIKTCISDDICPKNYVYEIVSTKECVSNSTCEDLITGKKKTSNNGISQTLNKMESAIENGFFKNEIRSGNDIKIIGDGNIFTITTTKNQKENYYANESVIDLGDCENILKKSYNISENVSLIILKIDIVRTDSIANEVEYEVYNPYNFKKLDLSKCKNVTITVYSPVNLTQEEINKYNNAKVQGFDLYNVNDSFYTELCTQFNSENDTDVTLSDRRDDYYDGNANLFQDNCTYKEINTSNSKVECQCNIKEEINTDTNNDVFSITKLISNFYDVFSNTKINIYILKCYNLVFSLKGQKNNYLSIIILLISLLNIIVNIINLFLCFKKIKLIIAKLIFPKRSRVYILANNLSSVKNKNKRGKLVEYLNNNSKSNTKKQNSISTKTIIGTRLIPNPPLIKSIKFVKKKDNSKKIDEQYSSKSNLKNKKSNNFLFTPSIQINNYTSIFKINNKVKNKEKILNHNNINNNNNNNFHYLDKKSKINNNNNNYIDAELNSMEYSDAIKYDKRKFYQYYFSLLKEKHLLFMTFFGGINDYNIFTLKISLFLSLISLHFLINTIFFNDYSIHQIYAYYGKYNVLFQLPKVCYSSIISFVITILLKSLALTQKDIIALKKKKKINIMKNNITKVLKRFKIKIIFYFGLVIILSFIYWYYLAAFGTVYKNTQVSLIKDTALSLGFSMIYPFFLKLFPVPFRIYALKTKNKKCIYTFSLYLAIL